MSGYDLFEDELYDECDAECFDEDGGILEGSWLDDMNSRDD